MARYKAAGAEAHRLGYMLFVDETGRRHHTHAASAAPILQRQASVARHLCNGTSLADAAERGVNILRGIVERDDPWPRPPR